MWCARSNAEVRVELTKGWKSGALLKPYTGYDASLLALNDELSDELLYAAHLIQIPDLEQQPSDCGEDEDGAGDGHDETDSFAEMIANIYTLDRACGVCQVLSEYRKKFPLKVEWMADYALLCHKTQAAPLCATTTFVTAFEFAFIMDKHYLPAHGASMVGEFGRRNLFLADVQKHFFLNGCFTPVEGGLVSKIDLNNYSFLVQSVARYAVTSFEGAKSSSWQPNCGAAGQQARHAPAGHGKQMAWAGGATVATRGPGDSTWNSPKTSSTAVALLKWREYARPLECFGKRRHRGLKRSAADADSAGAISMTCVQVAEAEDFARERELVDRAEYPAAQCAAGAAMQCPSKWRFADLTALLMAGTASLPARVAESSGATECPIHEIAAARQATVREYHDRVAEVIMSEQNDRGREPPRFWGRAAKPAAALGPILASVLPHPNGRGGTGGECLLCNLMLTEDYWRAIRLLKSKVVGREDTNTSLFDGVQPSVDQFEEYANTADGGRMLTLLKSVGPNAIYKHLFCDPLCAINALRISPDVLWGSPPSDPEAAELYKAELAARPNFSERVCRGVWILAFAFKAYQLAPPRPTALSTFIRSAESYLKRHGLNCIALEHALTRYV
ncbi:major envelope protein [Psittacid alphaherpesvirus 1]|uniref:Packaging protein UL32 n=1 Tax=Psittacid herpesvirus 1 (isolate Amazon parrot/-/97-0001/1997) TaxID=670426 RepID=UL32_PSHV1|nr:DNA packaging protein UL32 [Psittacid alphaherpesvirus 1]Q6UDJ9.1 RecName: Full=Packaging protein UL32 [Psittacid herpesvirus 1 Amazon parrot/1997]AAQ73711.1 major envelope protein [Psittacid alphaherpesvirus 1]